MDDAKTGSQLINRLIPQLPNSVAEHLKQYLLTAPERLLSTTKLLKLKKDHIFIREADPVDTIYLLVSGIVKAIDYRFYGSTYDYMWFYPVNSFGSLEVLLEQTHYQTTLSTVTLCIILVIPRNLFEQWIMQDIRVLRMEAKAMGSFLLEEVKRERIFLFMQGSDRLTYTLLHIYEHTAGPKGCMLQLTQQNLADSTGLSVKTISRSLKDLELSGHITRYSYKIHISEEQYQQMKLLIRQKYE